MLLITSEHDDYNDVMKYTLALGCLALFAVSLNGQLLDNKSLNGKYFLRHVLLVDNGSGGLSDASSLAGFASLRRQWRLYL